MLIFRGKEGRTTEKEKEEDYGLCHRLEAEMERNREPFSTLNVIRDRGVSGSLIPGHSSSSSPHRSRQGFLGYPEFPQNVYQETAQQMLQRGGTSKILSEKEPDTKDHGSYDSLYRKRTE